MDRLSQKTMHEDDFTGCPTDRLDRSFGNALLVPEQRQMRLEASRRPRARIKRITQPLLQNMESDQTVVAAQHEGTTAETQDPIELDAEGRHRHGSGALRQCVDQFGRRRYDIITYMNQRNMQVLGFQRPASQPVISAPPFGAFGDLACRFEIGANGKEQPISRIPPRRRATKTRIVLAKPPCG
jgi:hypothetical protein